MAASFINLSDSSGYSFEGNEPIQTVFVHNNWLNISHRPITGQDLLYVWQSSSTSAKLKYGLYAYIVWIFIKAVYRVYFHPLRHIPGPLLGKITTLYDFYYEVILEGKATAHAMNLEPIYGPVIRTKPNRVRVLSPQGWHEVHHVGFTFPRDPRLYPAFNLGGSIFDQHDPADYKARKQLLGRTLSKANMYNVESIAQNKVGELVETLRGKIAAGAGKANMMLLRVTNSVVTDISTEFVVGHSFDTVKVPNLDDPISEFVRKFEFPTIQFFLPNLMWFMQQLPIWLLDIIVPQMAAGNIVRKTMVERVLMYRDQQAAAAANDSKQEVNDGKTKSGTSNKLVVASALLSQYPNPQILINEVFVLVTAGIHGPAWTLASGIFNITTNDAIYSRVMHELLAAFPDKNSPLYLKTLEALPFLTACIKETLRLHSSNRGLLPRICAKPSGAEICGYHIPHNTGVDSSSTSVLSNPDIFPRPDEFIPTRWMEEGFLHDTEKYPKLERYLVSFASGTRICIGLHLAWMEVYVVLGTLLRRFHWEVSEEDRRLGWQWADRWLSAKRGSEGWAEVRERDD